MTLPDLIHINVTQEDIDNGRKFDSSRCPIALAIAWAVPESNYVCVDLVYIAVRVPNSIWYDERTYEVTEQITDFIANFDYGVKVTPFETDLRAAV